MKQKYILYSTSVPFNGYVVEWGRVDPDVPYDGTTVMEYITRRLSDRADLRLFLYPLSGPEMTEEMRESKKFDPDSSTLVDQGQTDITPEEQAAANAAAKASGIADNLPSWQAVSNAVDAISSLAEAKAFLKKLSRVVYWLARDSEV